MPPHAIATALLTLCCVCSSCRYGDAVEEYLEVYLRTPDLPKDDVARALVARGRARKGAGQKLLLMASRGQSHFFVVLGTYTADHVLSFHSAAVS